jgi:hypothetical protein
MTGTASRSAYQTKRSTPAKPEASRTGGDAGRSGRDREDERLKLKAAQQGIGKQKFNIPIHFREWGCECECRSPRGQAVLNYGDAVSGGTFSKGCNPHIKKYAVLMK